MRPLPAGVDGFINGLRRCGLDPVVEHGTVMFPVQAVGGVHAGKMIYSGVGTEELTAWPAVPPHWIHLPNEIGFARSNTQPSPVPSWTKHSRQMATWDTAEEPAQAWLAHVRSVLEVAA